MSLAEWEKVYYPKEPKKSMTEIEAIKHSIKKWQGLFPSVLKKYELQKKGKRIYDADSSFFVDDASCALCIKHKGCRKCSLKQVRSKVSCDSRMPDELNSPYHRFTFNSSPRLMLKWLRKALKQYETDHSQRFKKSSKFIR